MQDFWIGDAVKIRSKGKKGTYEGLFNGKAKVKTPSGYVYASPDDIELVPEDEDQRPLKIIEDEGNKIPKKKKHHDSTIDLHIDKLNPSMNHAKPELILNYQMRCAKDFLDDIISRRLYTATIIHGKGEGALKMEIENLVQNCGELKNFKSINDGGAIQIFFKYY